MDVLGQRLTTQGPLYKFIRCSVPDKQLSKDILIMKKHTKGCKINVNLNNFTLILLYSFLKKINRLLEMDENIKICFLKLVILCKQKWIGINVLNKNCRFYRFLL